ncbi:MAG: insulinase family protein [Chlamydiales bacterium]|nr:insulinase family protein [Chlamydiales bacterium]
MIRPLFFATILCIQCCANQLDYGIQEIEDRTDLPLLNPDLTNRNMAKLRLVNGLEILLISDPEADQSAAVMAVEAGSWNDPKEYPGMAHFCEHMLFMGSYTFPSENEFSKLIADYNGQTNAFTASDRTVYMFSSKTDGFLTILNRFAHFFIDPLFNPSGISRELHAVDQEYAKNLENDGWREFMVFKELGNPDHPNRGFSIGNSATLQNIPQQALKKWHTKYYGSNRMHLAIYSPLPLDELSTEVASLFASIPLTTYQPLSYEQTLTSEKQRGHITYIKPIKNHNLLSLLWELPPELSNDPAKSADLLAYVLNQGQKYSLYEKLKSEQLIDSVSIGVEDVGGKEHQFFSINLTLTEKGISQLETSVLSCFEALATYRSTGIPLYLYQEKNALAKLFYQYQTRQDAFQFAMDIGRAMPDEALETYPRHQILATSYDPEKIEQLLQFLTPESCVLSLLAPSELTHVQTDKKEEWFGAEYTVRPIPSEWLALWADAKPHPTIRLPAPNPFVANKLTILPTDGPSIPQKIAENEFGEAYYCRAPAFKTPETAIHLHIRSPQFTPDPRSSCMVSLYLDHLTDLLHPLLSCAQNAGLTTTFDFNTPKLSLEIVGFSEKATLLLQEIIQQMPITPPTIDQFNLYVERHKKSYLNSKKELAVYQGKELLDSLLTYGRSTKMQKLVELETITYEEFLNFHKKMFEKTYIEAMFGGNLSLKEAESSWLDVQHILAKTPYVKAQHYKKKILSLPEQGGPFIIAKSVESQGNAALLLLDQGVFTFEHRAAQEILSNALREAFFDTLRTKQKTGYIASSFATTLESRLFQSFVVQSNSHQPEDLLYRFELFLETFHEELATTIPTDRFEMIRGGMIHSLQTRFRNLQEKMDLWDMLAFEENGNFQFVEERIQALGNLSYEKFIETSKRFLQRDNRKRLAILCEGKLANPFSYELVPAEKIPSIATYSARNEN